MPPQPEKAQDRRYVFEYEYADDLEYHGLEPCLYNQIRDLAKSMSWSWYENSSDDDSESRHSLARTITHCSQFPGQVPMQDDDSNYIDSRLDPNSNDFDPKFWLEYLMKVKLSDPEYYNTSSLGLAFKNLRCYGRASDSDYQTNFSNFIINSLIDTSNIY